MDKEGINWKLWMKRYYSETPTDGPDAQCNKFSSIYDRYTEVFPSENNTAQMALQALVARDTYLSHGYRISG